jgi:hypothetical protein
MRNNQKPQTNPSADGYVRYPATPLFLTHSGWGEAVQAREARENGWPPVLDLLGIYLRK